MNRVPLSIGIVVLSTAPLSIDNSIDNTWKIQPRSSENQLNTLSDKAIFERFEGFWAVLSDSERFCGDFKAFAVLDWGRRMAKYWKEG